jgi:hypothetical protein
MQPTPLDLVAASLFGLALIHTFATKQIERLAHRFPRHAGLLHLLGEVGSSSASGPSCSSLQWRSSAALTRR